MKWAKSGTYRILAADVENKPGTYGPGDYTHPKITAIGAQFLDCDSPWSAVFNRSKPKQMVRAAEEFRSLWNQADAVMGHNFRQHDIKILGGLYYSLGLPLLAPKRMIDTYRDQPKVRGLSRSLENLAYRWECPIQKQTMPELAWEQAYDGIPEGVELMRRRVESDVAINIWLYHEARRRGLL